jgi:hypothetical protein
VCSDPTSTPYCWPNGTLLLTGTASAFQTWRRTELISSAPSLLIVEIAGPIENRRSLPLDPGRLLAMQMHLNEISRTVARGAVQWETPCANFAQQACRSRQSQCSVIIAYKVKAQHIVMFAFF